jgi:hypothetical protein
MGEGWKRIGEVENFTDKKMLGFPGIPAGPPVAHLSVSLISFTLKYCFDSQTILHIFIEKYVALDADYLGTGNIHPGRRLKWF